MPNLTAEENAKKFISDIGIAFNDTVDTLKKAGELTQDSLLLTFKKIADTYQQRLERNNEAFAFTPNLVTPLYALVNILPDPINFELKDPASGIVKVSSFHPRMLLWNGEHSKAHSHPADGKLLEKEISCAYYAATAGAIDVQYALDDATNGHVKSIKLLPERHLGTDRHSTEFARKFAHKFVPSDTPLSRITIIHKGKEQPVRTATFNLYNAAKPAEAAKSVEVTDTKVTFTARGISNVERWRKDFDLATITLTPEKDSSSFVASAIKFAKRIQNEQRQSRDDIQHDYRTTASLKAAQREHQPRPLSR
jgi:hypothetical protein